MNHLTHDVTMLTTGATLGGSLMTWFGENSNAIGAIVTVLTLILTGFFMYLNNKINKRRLQLEEERLEFDRRQVMKAEK